MVSQWLANGWLGFGSSIGSGVGIGENHSRSSAARVGDSLRVADGFEDKFWATYPRKKGKVEAQKAWRKVKPEEVEAIIARIELNKLGEWQGKALQYIPYPATWLNGRRWEDEIEPTGKPGCGASIRSELPTSPIEYLPEKPFQKRNWTMEDVCPTKH